MRISNDRNSFYQWDLNQLITDENFKLNDEVDFSTVKTRQALVVRVKNKNGSLVAEVPNILLQDYHPIYVHWMAFDENGEYVQQEAVFEVNKRVKPQDYVYTETEVWSYAELEERLKTLEGGGASPDAINKAVKEYLEENPIEVELPETLPNPNKLVLTGAVTAEYDGTETVVVEIPQGGTDIDLSDYATKKYVDDAIENIDISGGIVVEKDPTVPEWAKQPTKPSYTAEEIGALSEESLQDAINDALAQAKESGEFDGAPGKDGSDGAKGDKGDKGDPGYTPQKNIDYFDGVDGKDGEPGKDGYTPIKGVDYFDGKDGEDGKDGNDYILTEADKQEIASLVEVPDNTVTDEHINALIDAKLGVIENGTY